MWGSVHMRPDQSLDNNRCCGINKIQINSESRAWKSNLHREKNKTYSINSSTALPRSCTTSAFKALHQRVDWKSFYGGKIRLNKQRLWGAGGSMVLQFFICVRVRVGVCVLCILVCTHVDKSRTLPVSPSTPILHSKDPCKKKENKRRRGAFISAAIHIKVVRPPKQKAKRTQRTANATHLVAPPLWQACLSSNVSKGSAKTNLKNR